MNAVTQRLLSEALQLNDEEREALGLALLDPVRDPEDGDAVASAWQAEARTRLADLRAGRTTTIPWTDLEAQLRARLVAR